MVDSDPNFSGLPKPRNSGSFQPTHFQWGNLQIIVGEMTMDNDPEKSAFSISNNWSRSQLCLNLKINKTTKIIPHAG